MSNRTPAVSPEFMVRVHVGPPWPKQASVHVVKVLPGSAVAVRTTTVPRPKSAVWKPHPPLQLMPGGLLVTVPRPVTREGFMVAAFAAHRVLNGPTLDTAQVDGTGSVLGSLGDVTWWLGHEELVVGGATNVTARHTSGTTEMAGAVVRVRP